MKEKNNFYHRKLNQFGKVSQDVMRDPGVSIKEKAVYALLCSYIGETAYCYPSVSCMMDDLNTSESTVNRALRGLIKKGIIKRVPTPRGLASNTYITDEGYQQQWKRQLSVTDDIPTTASL